MYRSIEIDFSKPNIGPTVTIYRNSKPHEYTDLTYSSQHRVEDLINKDPTRLSIDFQENYIYKGFPKEKRQ
jgi:hypothetical protein